MRQNRGSAWFSWFRVGSVRFYGIERIGYEHQRSISRFVRAATNSGRHGTPDVPGGQAQPAGLAAFGAVGIATQPRVGQRPLPRLQTPALHARRARQGHDFVRRPALARRALDARRHGKPRLPGAGAAQPDPCRSAHRARGGRHRPVLPHQLRHRQSGQFLERRDQAHWC